jgi:MFS family permease
VRATLFRSLRVPNLRLFLTGQLTKLVGVWMLFIAQDWLVLELTNNSATALGLVTALQFTPVLLLTLYGGKLADRYDKQKLLVASNIVFAVLALALGVLVVSGAVVLWHVFAFAAGAGVVSAIETPTRQAFWSELVGPELLPNALSLGSATFNVARLVGPAVAGVAIAWWGTGTVVLITAAMCVVPVVLQLRIRAADLLRIEPGTVAARDARVVDGLKYVGRRPDLILVMTLVLVLGLFAFNFQLTLAVLSKTVFHTGAKSFGLLTSGLATGALIGALFAGLRRSRPSVYAVLVAAILFAAFESVLGLAPAFWVAAVLSVPTGFFMIYFAQSANQRIQLGVDPPFRGRVMALHVLLFFGTTPVGAPLVGWIAENYGARASIWLGGVISLVAALAVGVVQIRRSRARVLVHLRPRPHVHVTEAGVDGVPAVELRIPAFQDHLRGVGVRRTPTAASVQPDASADAVR